MCYCLEFQFDSVISDRTLILQRLLLIQVNLPSVPIFSWEFFLNRFDTLCLEAQLDLESNGEVNSLTGIYDLLNVLPIIKFIAHSKVNYTALTLDVNLLTQATKVYYLFLFSQQ